MATTHTPERTNTRIPPAVAARVVELSMLNPDFGAKRLRPLLKREDIEVSVSSVYSILRRHGLGNRENRLAKIKAADIAAVPALKAGASPSPSLTPALVSSPKPQHEIKGQSLRAAESHEAGGHPEALSGRRPGEKRRSNAWAMTVILPLSLVILAYSGIQATRIVRRALQHHQATLTPPSPPATEASAPESRPLKPFEAYREIWTRDLFSPGKGQVSAADKKNAIVQTAPAVEDASLVLVGTVVADKPDLSVAIIEDRRDQKQAVYRQGDQAGQARIKEILRDRIVMTTEAGDRLLSFEIMPSNRRLKPVATPFPLPAGAGSRSKTSAQKRAENNPWSFSLPFEELAAPLADTSRVLQQARFADYLKNAQPAGFKISEIATNSILKKMGLRDGDVIRGVNGEPVTGPAQAEDFLRIVAQGGIVEIKITRHRRTRYISLNIE